MWVALWNIFGFHFHSDWSGDDNEAVSSGLGFGGYFLLNGLNFCVVETLAFNMGVLVSVSLYESGNWNPILHSSDRIFS